MKQTFPEMAGFTWQDGYGAFAVSKSNLPPLISYIEHQREHHAKRSFQEELLALLACTKSNTTNATFGHDVPTSNVATRRVPLIRSTVD